MLLSRFWYVVLALVLGGAVFVLFLATSMYNRAGSRAMGEGLSADAQVVSWYMKDDARQRSAQLIKFALNQDIAKYLAKSSESEGERPPAEAREKVAAALRAVNEKIDEEFRFDAVFAVDQHGRVVAHLGYEQASGLEDFELGGYPVVADALHGYIRDDTLVLDRLYRVVTRPVEFDLGQLPAGAIVGARIIDDRFARELSGRTGAAVAFYTRGQRVASGAPEGFDRSQLDQIVSDLPNLEEDEEYRKLGRSSIRTLAKSLGVQYTRLPGEAWELGAGFAVGRMPGQVDGPMGFFRAADDKDKSQANIPLVAGLTLAAMLLGLLFTVFEHSRPLWIFRREAQRLAKGEADQMQPSKFRGVYRKIAADLNDGIDVVAAKGGVPRRAADLNQVLGDLPAEPQMSAFSFPGDSEPAAPPSPADHPAVTPKAKPMPKPPPRKGAPQPPPGLDTTMPSEGVGSTPGGGRPPPPRRAAAAPDSGPGDEAAEWRRVYEEFVATKKQCNENIEGFTYEKFEQTLKKNRDTLVQRHGAKHVKFSVYVKEGKAALKASPIKE
ncbi:MAG: MXAN_5187 family protein [Polyangiaceae bacterium]